MKINKNTTTKDALDAIKRMSDRDRRIFACDCASYAMSCIIDIGKEPDLRSLRAIEVSRLFAVGKATDQERRSALSDASDAARQSRDYSTKIEVNAALAAVYSVSVSNDYAYCAFCSATNQ
jgi:hypothetical protein